MTMTKDERTQWAKTLAHLKAKAEAVEADEVTFAQYDEHRADVGEEAIELIRALLDRPDPYAGAGTLIDPGEADLDNILGNYVVCLVMADGTEVDVQGADTYVTDGLLVWRGYAWDNDNDRATEDVVEFPYDDVKIVRVY